MWNIWGMYLLNITTTWPTVHLKKHEYFNYYTEKKQKKTYKKCAKLHACNTLLEKNRSGLKWICIFFGWLVIDLCVCLIGDGFICLSDPALICSSGCSGLNWLAWWDPTGFEHKQTLMNIFTWINLHCPDCYFRRMWKECVCPEWSAALLP